MEKKKQFSIFIRSPDTYVNTRGVGTQMFRKQTIWRSSAELNLFL